MPKVHQLPKGTLHPERPTKAIELALEALRQAELARKRPVIASKGQGFPGMATPSYHRDYEPGAQNPGRGWNPHDARMPPVRALVRQ